MCVCLCSGDPELVADDVACKMLVLRNLITRLKEEGHRTLVFSQSRLVLNRIHRMLKRQVRFAFIGAVPFVFNDFCSMCSCICACFSCLYLICTISFALQGFKLCRIDGTLTDPNRRQARVTAFNRDPSFDAFLLTTQVGGLGLTLTGADRVIICTCFIVCVCG